MKAGWAEKRFDEVLEIRNGKNQREVESKDGEYPIFGSAGNVMGYATSFICEAGTTIIGRKGNINTPIFSETRFWNVDTAFGLAAKPELDSKYLYYYCLSFDFSALNRGTTIPSLVKSELLGISIPVAPLPEQQRIVTLLDEAFDCIATARANAEQNLQNARALFENHLQSVFSLEGNGWVQATVGDTCILKSGTSVSVVLERPQGDFPYLKVADMNHSGNEREIVSSSRFLKQSDIGKNAVFPTGTTIFPKRGGSILTNKKRLTAVPICADLNIMGVTPGANLLPEYLYFYFLNVDMRKLGGGSSIPQINNYDIEPLLIAYPSIEAQAEIVQRFETLQEETQRLESIYQRKLAALDALKKSLLHQAFSGAL